MGGRKKSSNECPKVELQINNPEKMNAFIGNEKGSIRYLNSKLTWMGTLVELVESQ